MNQVNQVNQFKADKLTYISEIDGLRALAVFSVVLFHFFPSWLDGGYLGVDIFFVISGFLITRQLISFESTSIKEALLVFYKRRIARLFPALFLFLLLTYVVVKFFLLSTDIAKFESSLISAYSFWSNIYFWRDGGYFGGNEQLKPLLHIWSLSVEEQFYLLSPLIILLLTKLNAKIKKSLLIGVFGVVLASFFLWHYLHFIGGSNPAFFLLPTRVWQFGLGALIAIKYAGYVTKFEDGTFRKVFLSISLLLIIVGILSSFDSQVQTILVSVGTAGFINFVANNSFFIAKVFRTKSAVFFGKISYSLYLYHWPIAVGLNYYFIEHVPLAYSLLGITASIVFGWLSFSLIENRFRYSRKFSSTLLFLLFCITASLLLYFVNFKNDKTSLSNVIGNASGTNYRCDIASYRPYGASRACVLKTSVVEQSTIVLLGNSHAQMYAPMFMDMELDNINILLVPLNGCLPTTSINISSKCISLARKNLSTVLADKSVVSVVVASTWYAESYVDENGVIVSSDKLFSEMKALMDEIKGSGKRPILFSPIPIPSKDYASELARALHFNKITETEALDIIRAPRLSFDTKFAQFNNDLVELLGTSYIRIYDELCDQSFCYYGRDDVFYFADSNHLSKNVIVQFENAKEQLRIALERVD
ncbi:acyltransferase [Alphaproteobacteria bacterium]|nr:acyltransferase [Alphaproteobacteria bacterium]